MDVKNLSQTLTGTPGESESHRSPNTKRESRFDTIHPANVLEITSHEWSLSPLVEGSVGFSNGTEMPDSSSYLCTICSKIFTSHWVNTVNHVINLEYLWKSAQRGCMFCYLQLQGFPGHVSPFKQIEDLRVWISFTHLEGGHWASDYSVPVTILRIIYGGKESRFVKSFEIFRDHDIDPLSHGIGPANSTRSKESFDLVETWISNCSRDHPECNRVHSRQRRLPTRLLFLGSGATIRPRLIESRDLPLETPYVTLSHCWEKNPMLVLTTNTLEAMKNKIEFSRLSKTFQDAIEAARRLGIHYLWIDSFCIIQDCDEDWIQESSQMADVYANSWCNFAAANSSNDLGLFSARDPRRVKTCKIRKSPNSRDTPEFSTVIDWMDSTNNGHRRWREEITNSKVLSRGWVFQELLLAPRTLYFGHVQLFWECSHTQAMEATCSPVAYRISTRACGIRNPPTAGFKNNFSEWHRVVEEYSKRVLTYPLKDKLVAISAIAKEFGREETYLAGLWKQDLAQQLLWRVTDLPPTESNINFLCKGHHRTEAYQAPSWSWASINGAVQYHLLQSAEKTYIFVLDIWRVEIQPAGISRFGRVLRGQLYIRGSLTKVKYCSLDPSEYFSWTVDDDDMDSNDVHSLYCLPIAISKDAMKGSHVLGLVVQSTRLERGEYCRRGFFYVSCGIIPGSRSGNVSLSRDATAGIRDFKASCWKFAAEIEEHLYVSGEPQKHGLPMYSINLV